MGFNTATLDGSVRWTPVNDAMLGYPAGGGHINMLRYRLLEPLRQGRPGMMP